jgi:molybdate transport system permease protein
MIKVIIPCIVPYIISGPIITFAHTIGGFGVVLITWGNIPGVTKVASIEIYELIEGMNYGAAHVYSLILLAISVTVISMLNWLNKSEVRNII